MYFTACMVAILYMSTVMKISDIWRPKPDIIVIKYIKKKKPPCVHGLF